MSFHIPGTVKGMISGLKHSEVTSAARPFESPPRLDDEPDQHLNGESEVEVKEVPFKTLDMPSQVTTNAAKQESLKQETETNALSANGDISHQIISSYFIGPKAENLDYFKANILNILESQRNARTSYYPEDDQFITSQTQNTPAFKESMDKLSNAVKKAAKILGEKSVPFWSPRYEGHMCPDMSMAALLGYFMTMLYNPNNVAFEASPISTVAEMEVGDQLCTLFGYNTNPESTEEPRGWGHITCDGTVANLESMWVARNLKYYPLSLREAMKHETSLNHLNKEFYVETCDGKQKLFSELNHWDLLNLKPNDILDIPDKLNQEHGISHSFLSSVMEKYTIQSTGKDALEGIYTKGKPAQYICANTRHYSWPKGAAICGIGSDNVIGISVDNGARLDIAELKEKLEEHLAANHPVLAVVAIIGSTEEGAVDSLSSILALRKQFQAKGLSFLVHADAAWGGYFCTMLPKNYHPGEVINLPTEMGASDGFVPDASLRPKTQEDLFALRFADSITVDPHKAGYIPYPAGGLCYRDGRMRFLVTWTSPYISRGSDTSIGIYGVEGSKPGAAAVSTWLSNKTIGLTQDGYGSLLGEVTWTCSRLAAEWAALTFTTDSFICVPLNELPSERAPKTNDEILDDEKARIRREIISKSNAEILSEDAHRPDNLKATKLLRDLGSDLNINAFSLNFRLANGSMNDDVEEANYLTLRVVKALSVESPQEDPTKIPLYLSSTMFSNKLYGDCKKNFMGRLRLQDSNQDLMVLRNVVMSPFPSDRNFVHNLAQIFRDTVEKEAKIVRERNKKGKDFYSFLIQGTEHLYLVHLPMFHVANHRQQLIVSVDFDKTSKDTYLSMRKSNLTEPMILVTQHKTLMEKIIQDNGTFLGQIMTKESGIILKDVTVTVTRTVVSQPLNSQCRQPNYPDKFIPFYLYGNEKEAHIDHVLVKAPNTQLSASGCTLNLLNLRNNKNNDIPWDKRLVLVLEEFYEAQMQPFPSNSEIVTRNGAIIPYKCADDKDSGITSETRSGRARKSGFFFRPGKTFNAHVHLDHHQEVDSPSYKLGEHVATGTITLGDAVYVDSEAMNFDPYEKVETIDEWQRELDKIAKELE